MSLQPGEGRRTIRDLLDVWRRDPSSTSWLEAHTETLSNRQARPRATAALRGDKRMVRRAPPSELRPVSMAAAMAPVPTNPRVIDVFFIVPEVRSTDSGA